MAPTPDRAKTRLSQELYLLQHSPIPGILAQPTDSNNILSPWKAIMQGPPSTPFEGGTFHLTLRFPPNYPLAPPTLTMESPIYHPNIDSKSGFVGKNILSLDWSPVLTVERVLLSLQALMAEPDCEDTVVPEIAHECRLRREMYEKTARAWTERYAMGGIA